MSNELVRTQLANSLELTSLKAMARDAESVMLLIDCSSSMNARLRNGKVAIDALREVVRDIKAEGTLPIIAFGGPYDAQVRFVDAVPAPDGGTPLHMAIPFAKQYGATRVVVISDGMPDLTEQSLIEAKAFGGQIDVVFVGNPGDGGSVFLDELARITGGKRFEGDLGDTKKLSDTVIGLLEGEVELPRAPIQGSGFTADESEPADLDDSTDEDFEDAEDEDEND